MSRTSEAVRPVSTRSSTISSPAPSPSTPLRISTPPWSFQSYEVTQTVSIMRISSSRATIAVGTSPPRVTAITPFHGPIEASRQASALASR